MKGSILRMVSATVLVWAGAEARAQGDGASSKAFQQIEAGAAAMVKTRPISASGQCKPHPVPRYDGLPTMYCEYTRFGRRASIVLIEPDATQIARWVHFVCEGLFVGGGAAVDQNFLVRCGGILLKQLDRRSKAQFLVAGTLIKDGRSFPVRDGMIVEVAGIANGTKKQLTNAQLAQAMSAPVTGWRGATLFEGITYEDYLAHGRMLDASNKLIDESNLTFPQMLVTRFKQAWGFDFYTLLRGWACAHQSKIQKDGACAGVPKDAPGAARSSP